MKMKYVLVLLSLQILTLSFCFAQEKYVFEASSQAYENLKDPIVLNDSNYPDFYDELMVEVDFPIFYFGKKMYSILVKNRGEVVFGNLEERIELFPVRLKIKSNSKISYKVEGTPDCGNRILKIEYQNMGFKCDLANYYFVNVQLWIYENTGIIEIHFGESLDNPEIYDVAENNCNGDFYYGSRLRFNSNLSAMPYDNPDQPKFFQGDLLDLGHAGIGAIPSPGTLYRFDPEIYSDSDFEIHPNPARLFTHISRPINCGDFQVKVFDTRGQFLFQKEFTYPSQFLDTSDLIPGIYFVQVWYEEKRKSFVKKLLIL